MAGKINIKLLGVLAGLLAATWLGAPRVSPAASETPNDLIRAVNDLRALHGLDAYQSETWLMGYAQEHAEYLASIGHGSHEHSDGTLPWEIGLQENVASGDEGIVTVEVVVNQIWVDWGHRTVLIGYLTGEIGAGVALGGDGQVYYTIDIRPGEKAGTLTPQPGTSLPFTPVQTSTPDENGAIIHVVGAGETLWSIAISYGVTVNEIRGLNGIAGDDITITIGQRLLIRTVSSAGPEGTREFTPVPTKLLTQTTLPAMRTRTPTEWVITTPAQTRLPAVTMTATPASTPEAQGLESKNLGAWIMLILGMIGVVIVLVFGFWKPRNER